MTTSRAASVEVASPAERDRALGILTLAFSTDPVARWLYPEPGEYATIFPRLADLFGGRAFENGTAHFTEDRSAAALWLPPGVTPESEAMGELIAESLPAERHESVFAVLGQMGDYHPHDAHWYLPLIGVDPVRQGQGLGSALLSHALAECDRQHLPAYLESSNPKNVPLYERHGFEVIGKIQAGESPVIYPMVRKAR